MTQLDRGVAVVALDVIRAGVELAGEGAVVDVADHLFREGIERVIDVHVLHVVEVEVVAAHGDLVPVVEALAQGRLGVGREVDPEDALLVAHGVVFNVLAHPLEAVARPGLANVEVGGKEHEQNQRYLVRIGAHCALFKEGAHVRARLVFAAQRVLQGVLVKFFSGLLLQKRDQLAELADKVVFPLLRPDIGHVQHEVLEPVVLAQVAESADVRVADHRGRDAEHGQRDEAGVGRAEKIFVVGAQRLRNAAGLGVVDEPVLKIKAGEEGGQRLHRNAVEPEALQQFDGGEDVRPRAALGVIERVGDVAVGHVAHVAIGLGDGLGLKALAAQAFGVHAGAQELLRLFGVVGHVLPYSIAVPADELFTVHGHPGFHWIFEY